MDGCSSDSSCQHPSVVGSAVDSSGCAAVFTLHTLVVLQCSRFTPELCCSVRTSHLSVKHLFSAAFVDATRTIAILIVKIMTSNYYSGNEFS